MDAQELQKLDIAGIYHTSTGQTLREQDVPEVTKFAEAVIKAWAERAVSPAESVQSIDTPEFGLLIAKLELAATQVDHSQPTAPNYEAAFKALAAHIDAKIATAFNDGAIEGRIHQRGEDEAKIAAAHAEGRRSAMEELQELAREKERRDRIARRAIARLNAAEGEEPSVIGAGFADPALPIEWETRAELELKLAKEKERADRLDTALKEWLDKTQWVQDAVQSSKFGVMYLGYHRADVIRKEFDKLAQPLQQEGGKEAMLLLQDAARAWNNERDTELDEVMERVEIFLIDQRKAQPSDNLQQASTAQVEPAKGEYISDAKCDVGCKHSSHCRDSDQCTINWYAASATDAKIYEHIGKGKSSDYTGSAAQATPEGEVDGFKAWASVKYRNVDEYTQGDFALGLAAWVAGRKELRAALASTTAAEPVAWSYECLQPLTNPPIWCEFFSREKPVNEHEPWMRNVVPLYRAAPPQQVDTGGLPG